MSPRFRIVLPIALATLVCAFNAHAQLTLRGDYAAARGITELSALYARQNKTSVVVTPFSTNAGIEGVLKGEIDVATSARGVVPTRPAEKDLVFWPVAWDAVVFIVHPSNPVRNLTVAQIRDIYQGKLDNWSAVGGRNAPIDLYSVMGPYDGLESTIRQVLFANPGYMAKIDRLFLNQHQIEVGIQMDPDAIGMTTLAGLNKQRVKALSIEGVAANKDSVANGSYLLTTPLYMVYRADNPKSAEITRFAEFLRTPAAESVIVNKRLVPHREDDNFKAMQVQRLANLWVKLGGQPIPPNAIRAASSTTGTAMPAVRSANTTRSAASASAKPTASAPPAAAAANTTRSVATTTTTPTANVKPTATSVASTVPAVEPATAPTTAGSQAEATPNGSDAPASEPACRKRWPWSKC